MENRSLIAFRAVATRYNNLANKATSEEAKEQYRQMAEATERRILELEGAKVFGNVKVRIKAWKVEPTVAEKKATDWHAAGLKARRTALLNRMVGTRGKVRSELKAKVAEIEAKLEAKAA